MTDHFRALSLWIDGFKRNLERDPEALLWSRVSKVAAEAGEALDALSGMSGENPRKGVTHNAADLQYELLDVATAALGAVCHLNNNSRSFDVVARLLEHAAFVAERAGLGAESSGADELSAADGCPVCRHMSHVGPCCIKHLTGACPGAPGPSGPDTQAGGES